MEYRNNTSTVINYIYSKSYPFRVSFMNKSCINDEEVNRKKDTRLEEV